MNDPRASQAVQGVLNALKKELGNRLEGFYLYGSLPQGYYQPGQSDVNILAIVADGTSIHAIRDAFQPAWQRYGAVLGRAPVIAQQAVLKRHLLLNPLLAHHLAMVGKQPPGFDFRLAPAPADREERLGRLAYKAMVASAALAPELLGPEQTGKRLERLRHLARHLGRRPVSESASALNLFTQIQRALGVEIAQLPAGSRWLEKQLAGAPPHLPRLQAIYEENGQMVMVLPDMGAGEITKVPWHEVAELLSAQCDGMEVTTASQLRLIVQYETPADYQLKRYNHEWGYQVIANLDVPAWRVLRDAARLPSEAETTSLPNAYLTSGDDELHVVIHDFQNKLLNTQLQHELLGRAGYVPRTGPPEPLPGRTAHPQQRIDAIFAHLNWWANYYTNEMMQAQPRG